MHRVLLLTLPLAACSTAAPDPDRPGGFAGPATRAPASPAGSETGLSARVEGRTLGREAILNRLAGRLLSVCYPNGQMVSEILGNDGVVRDPRNGEALARYRVQADRLCFSYPNRPSNCYTVSADSRGLYFYQGAGADLVASTACPIPQGTQGLR